jgi:solute carrier family 25 protein 39/40
MRSMLHSFLHDHHHHHQHAPPQQQAAVRPAAIVRAVPRMWTGFSATLVRDVPFSALYWAMVEPLRQAMLPKNSHWHPFWQQQQRQQSSSSSSWSRSNMFRPVHHTQLEILIANMFSGFVAGGLAAGLTTPFDVVKTRMQIAQPGSGSSSSGGGIRVWQVLRDVYHKEGLEGLFTGVKPRAYRAAPACAIVISVYELLKDMLASADVGLAVAQQAAHAG